MESEPYIDAELDRTIHLVRHYHQQKLEYKKLFIATVSISLGAILVIQMLPVRMNQVGSALLNMVLPTDRLVGVVALLQGLAGFFVAKTLASLRKSEILQHNAHAELQQRVRSMLDLGLPPFYLKEHTLNRGGADYLSIFAISACSGIYLVFGSCLFIDSFSAGKWMTYAILILLVAGYTIAHWFVIEATLHADQPAGSRPPIPT